MLACRDICLSYPAAPGDGPTAPVLNGASIALEPCEVVALVGANGAGKSTLARVLAGSLVAGSGEVLLDGSPVSADELRHSVGFVRQDPESQLVAPTVFDEVSFGPCNLGLPQEEVRSRVAEALAACGLAGFDERLVSELSGGELQRVAIAGVVAMRPRYLVLDEVTSQLDGGSRGQVRSIVRELAASGVGVLMVTHDLEEIAAATRVAVMGEGNIRWEGLPGELLSDEPLRRSSGILGSRLEGALVCLVDAGYELARGLEPERMAEFARVHGVADRLLALLSANPDASSYSHEPASNPDASPQCSLALHDIVVRYDEQLALGGVSLQAQAGRVTLVAGPSGSGKSTAAGVAAGIVEPSEGLACVGDSLVRPGRVGLCLQRAEDQLFCDTVLDDVAFGPANLGASPAEAKERAARALGRMGLADSLWGRSPFALSGGQRRRAALAGIIAMEPEAYVLDEPTVGLDAAARGFLHAFVRELAEAGSPVLVVSHDLGEWLDVADDVVLICAGRVSWQGTAEALVRDPSPLVTAGVTPPLWLRLREALAMPAAAAAAVCDAPAATRGVGAAPGAGGAGDAS